MPVFLAPSSSDRRAHAPALLTGLPPATETLTVSATRLADRGLTPATGLGTEAVAARAVFEARKEGTLSYFAPVANMPGFPPSLARTLTDLRMAAAPTESLTSAGESGPDLATLYEAAAAQFRAGGAADRA